MSESDSIPVSEQIAAGAALLTVGAFGYAVLYACALAAPYLSWGT